MNEKISQRCRRVAEPSLLPGEQIELTDVVQLGKVSAKKQVGLGIASVAVGVATGGTLIVALRPRAYFVVVTDRRILLIDNNRGSMGKKVVSAVPRELITAGPLRGRLLTYRMNVVIDGAEHRFSWGRAQPGAARRFAATIGAPTA